MDEPELLSVFTPSHDPRFLGEAHYSLCQQSYEDWEWVVLLNQGAKWACDDERVWVISDDSVDGVGAAKARACEECQGEILVELDHDDGLVPHALEAIAKTYAASPELALVYSHCSQIQEDGSPDYSHFDQSHGWEYRDAGRGFEYAVSMQATPHNVSYIWYAPNHVRAFSRRAYDAAGGYDPKRRILDDQDLMCRLYQVGDFKLIDERLYYQRMHEKNTQRDAETNAQIQVETIELYDHYVEQNALAWSRREGLLALDLGANHGSPPGYLGVDRLPGADVIHELPAPLPLKDNSVGVIRAVDFLEHVADKVGLFNELYRVLAPGGMLLSQTPSTDGRGAFQDPTHVAFYNENSFWYFTEQRYQQYVPEITARFQTSRLVTYFPTDWHREHDISYVTANLIALKDGPRNGGPLFW